MDKNGQVNEQTPKGDEAAAKSPDDKNHDLTKQASDLAAEQLRTSKE